MFTAEPEVSRVIAYWESERLMSAAVETSSDTYILEVGLSSYFSMSYLECSSRYRHLFVLVSSFYIVFVSDYVC